LQTSTSELQQTDAKRRLVRAALQVFASKGYEGASTREICRLADVNVAGIHYYFGDKASLYREVFRIPEQMGPFPVEMVNPNVSVRSALVAFYGHIMAYIATAATRGAA
jgi:Bacterial regulatory proteins, tetR family